MRIHPGRILLEDYLAPRGISVVRLAKEIGVSPRRIDPCERSLGDNARLLGGLANPRAVTRVNPEQASKVKMRTPTRLNFGEGRCVESKQSTSALLTVRRGSGNGTGERLFAKRGRPRWARGNGSRRCIRQRLFEESERPIVLRKPVNAGGGKGPCFWVLLKEPDGGGLA